MSDDKAFTEAPPPSIIDDEAPLTKLERENDEAAAELNTSSKDNELSMGGRIYSPFRNYYEGRAFSVSAVNPTGPFDILPRHHNFISLLSHCELVVRTNKGEQTIKISGGS